MTSRIPMRAARMIAALLTAGPLLLFAAAPAGADTGDGTTVASVLGGVEPAAPAGVDVQVLPDGQMSVVNPTSAPLEVSAPDGVPFLRVSAAGVEQDAAHPFTYSSRVDPRVGVRVPADARPGAPARWTRVSGAVSWNWHDPRLRPDGVQAPTGGRPGSRQVLASWTVPMTSAGAPLTVRGTFETWTSTGSFRTVADPSPAGIDAVVADGERPSMILRARGTGPVTVLGVDGEPFLRRALDGGWEADPASRTYRHNLTESGQLVPAGSEWRRYAEPGPVSWADDRLRAPVEVDADARSSAKPTDVARWAVPVEVDGRRVEVTGVVRFTPRPGADTGSPVTTALALGAAVTLLAAGLVALTVRNRRLSRAAGPDPVPDHAPPAVDDHADHDRGAPVR